MKNKLTMLAILDGVGMNESETGNAVLAANTPNLDRFFKEYNYCKLDASSEPVGLPNGQMGNSEVGHMNIGAGRIVYQELSMINNEIKTKNIYKNERILEAINHAKENNSKLHIMGLLSDGGVHSHILHLKELLLIAKENSFEDVLVHGILDGRDVPPKSAEIYIKDIEDFMKKEGIGQLASIAGRFFTMDRDKRWERVKVAYDMMTDGENPDNLSPLEYLNVKYGEDQTDEFIDPMLFSKKYRISDNDSILMFNFRPDRAREIARVFSDESFNDFEMGNRVKNIRFTSMTQYDETLENVHIAYPPQFPKNTLGEYLSSLKIPQLRIAETEKYAHVTFFFNGRVEKPYPLEDRVLIPSPKVKTYDMKPEMSCNEITDKLIEIVDQDKYEVVILNFANGDMVGHTGDFNATVKAMEVLDNAMGRLEKKFLEKDGQIFMTSDHGNADYMLDENGNTVTSHSTKPVPFIHIAKNSRKLKDGKLADIAPTMLKSMGIKIPEEMTGECLLID